MYICLPERYIACPINLSGTTCIILSAATLNSAETMCSSMRTIQPCLKEFFKDFAPSHEAGFVGQTYTVRNSSCIVSLDNQNLVTDNIFIYLCELFSCKHTHIHIYIYIYIYLYMYSIYNGLG